MRCPQCNRTYEAASAFCTYCGVALVADRLPHAMAGPVVVQPPVQQPPTVMPAASPVGYAPPARPGVSVSPNAPMSGAAVASLVVDFFFSPVGIILGHIAMRNIGRDRLRGRGVAIAGLIVGYVLLPFHLANWGIAIYAAFQYPQ